MKKIIDFLKDYGIYLLIIIIIIILTQLDKIL